MHRNNIFSDKVILGITIDGGGSAIVAASDEAKGCRRIPNNSVITAWYIYADQSGSIVVDMWKDTWANHPPTAADSTSLAIACQLFQLRLLTTIGMLVIMSQIHYVQQ